MITAKQAIVRTPDASHGAFDYHELLQLGLSPDEVIDFSVNSNPYGPVPGVHEALARVPLERYPDRECLALRHKLAAMHDITMDHIVVGNGSAELLLLVACAFLERGAVVALPHVTFSEYERVARLMGAEVRMLPRPGDVLQANPEDFDKAMAGVRLVLLCNPNNPDGALLPLAWLQAQAERHPHTLFVIDEAYANFLLVPQTLIPTQLPNILVLRSLTKDYALAGLRLGYAVGHPDCIEAIRRVRPAWNVNALAQAAGLAVLEQTTWLREMVARLHADKARVVSGLRELGLHPQPSLLHYFLVRVGNGRLFRDTLLRYRLMVRDCASFGLSEYVRIATRTPEDNWKLLDAVASVSGESSITLPT